MAQLSLSGLYAHEIDVNLYASADEIDEQAGRERMCRNYVGIQLSGFEYSYCSDLGAKVDRINNKQSPGRLFNDRLDIIFRDSTGIDQPGGDFCLF